MIDVSQLWCPKNGNRNEAGTHHMAPRYPGAASQEMACRYCDKSEKQLREEADEEEPNRDDLRARLAAVRAGDTVTATFEFKGGELKVTGVVGASPLAPSPLHLTDDGELYWARGNSLATVVLSLDSHTPATPPEPEGDAIYKDPYGLVWHRVSTSRGDEWMRQDGCYRTWPQLMRKYPNGTVFVPVEKGEDRD